MLQIIDNSIGEVFVKSILLRINNHIPYCLARGKVKLSPLKSDTDIVIKRKDYKFFFNTINGLQDELHFVICNVIKRYYVYTHIIFLKGYNVFVQIDTEFDFDWWSFRIINAKDILNRSQVNSSISYASDLDSSFMKFYRSLLWGGRVSKKCKNTINLFDFDFVNKLTFLKTPENINPHELSSYYSSNISDRLKKTRKKLILSNLKTFGFIKTFYRFCSFILIELKLLFSKNGVVLNIHGDDEIINELKNNLNEYVNIYNAPFKEIIYIDNISYLKKRKLLRDSYLLISNTKINSDFELIFNGDSFYLKNKDVLIDEGKYSDFIINNFINIIYNF